MQNPQEVIKTLQQAIAKQDSQQILKLSSTLMKENPQDLQYKLCYAISAIKSKSFAELASGIFKEKPHDKGLQKIYYYYLYASGQFQKCIQYLQGTKDQGLLLLLAQAYFKVLQYQKSINIMSELLKAVKLNQEDKQLYMINLLAASTPNNLQKVKQFQFLVTSNILNKQIFYNYALYLYLIGDHEKALQFLSNFEQDLTQDNEVDKITAKLFKDYIAMTTKQSPNLNKQKKIEQYKTLSKTVKDENLLCVINNNLVYLSSNYDAMGEQYKHLQQLNDPKIKISLMQSIALRINRLSFLNRKNRMHDTQKIINQLDGQHIVTRNNSQFVINKYFVHKKNKEYELAEKYVRAIMQENINLGFCLLVDLCQQNGNNKSIIDSLQFLSKTDNEHAKNYIFSLLIKDSNLFSQYSDYLDQLIKKSTEPKTLQILLKLYQNKQDKNKQIFVLNRILEINPKNSNARVSLAQVYLQNKQFDKVEQLLKGIEKPSQITDINYLQYIQKNIHVSKKQQDKHGNQQEKKTAHKKRIKKKKKVRLPKNVEKPTPNFKPDPQRWLPKWQRKGYKKKGKKGGNKTQGLSTVGMEEKNIYNAANSTSSKQVTKQTKKRR